MTIKVKAIMIATGLLGGALTYFLVWAGAFITHHNPLSYLVTIPLSWYCAWLIGRKVGELL